MTIRIGIVGIAGRMGRLLAEEVPAAGAAIAGGTLRFGTAPAGIQVLPDFGALCGASEVVIDFTHAGDARIHAATAAETGTPLVLGSSGLSLEDEAAVAEAAKRVAIVYAGNEQAAEKTADECRALGGRAECWRCDAADFAAVKQTVAEVKKEFGAIDILVNNAGINRDGLLAMMKEQDFDDVIATNLKGAFNFLRHCSPVFIRQHGGAGADAIALGG